MLHGRSILGLALLCASAPIFAQSIHLPDNPSLYLESGAPQARLIMAAAEQDAASRVGMSSAPPESAFEEPMFSANKWHQYLGLGSLALAGLTVLAPKQEGKSAHHYLGVGAATLGGAAVVSGLTFHYKDLSLQHPFKDPDTLHALLGALGTLGYLLAVNDAPEDLHPTYGIMGAVSMAVAIKLTW